MDPQEGQAANAAEPKKSKTLLIVVLMSCLLLFGVGGFVTYSYVLKGGDETPADDALAEVEEVQEAMLYRLEPFIVNLVDDQGIRYMKLQLQLELKDMDELTMERNIPKIRDSLVVLFSSKRFDEIATIEGKARLREEVLYRLDRILGEGKAQAVYFTDFVVQ
jgi:flagellar FliL protein